MCVIDKIKSLERADMVFHDIIVIATETTPRSHLPNKSRSPSRTGQSITDKNRNTFDMRSTSKPKHMVKSSVQGIKHTISTHHMPYLYGIEYW